MLLFACDSKETPQAKEYYGGIQVSTKSEILASQIKLDSIILENLPSSYTGYIRVFADTLFFVDYLHNRIFPITIDGAVLPFRLGNGRGPKEFFGGIIHDLIFFENGGFVIQGTSWDLYYYNYKWEFEEQKSVDWQIQKEVSEKDNTPDPRNPHLYSFNHMTERDKARTLNNFGYFEILSYHPYFNMFYSRHYYRKAKLIAKLNLKTGVVEELLGLRSLVYENYEFIGHFSRAIYDAIPSKKEFFLGFEPDPLIYVCDSTFRPVRAFGLEGLKMNKNYTEYAGFDEAQIRQILRNDRKLCGYYTSLEYIEERDLLFRSYSKGSHSHYDGLQIYRNEVLIADVDVPKGFKVEGYVAPYFISGFFPTPLYESGKIYLFKLDF